MSSTPSQQATPTMRPGGVSLVVALGALLCVASAVIWVLFLRGLAPFAEVELRWWFLIPLFAVTEVFVIHLDVQREAQTISLSEIPIVLGLFFSAPAELVASQVIGAGLVLIVYRRQSLTKLLFNVGQLALVTSISIGLFRSLVPDGDATGPWPWLAAFATTFTADLIAAGLVSTAIALLERWTVPRLATFVGIGSVSAFANTALGLAGVELVRGDILSGVLLIVPLTITYLAYRGFWREHRRSEHFEFMYQSMVRLNTASDLDTAHSQLLQEARSMFNADIAGLVLFSDDPSEPHVRSVLGPADAMTLRAPIPANESVVHSLEPLLISAKRGTPDVPLPILGCSVHDAIAVTLLDEERLLGMVLVANRLSDVNSFTKADLRFLRAFGTHALLSVEKRHLQHSIAQLSEDNDELNYRSLHDPLTHLPNRVLFVERLERALTRRDDPDSRTGILFIDLDDFKYINDTYGHVAGDKVLIAMAERIRACIGPADTAARLGGDEFAVLLENIADDREAEVVAERILDALRVPIWAGEHQVPVGASIGQGVVRSADSTAEEALQMADTAMYAAKRRGKGRWAPAPPHLRRAEAPAAPDVV